MIQQILVYDNAVEYLFNIIEHEGIEYGGVLAKDCLLLMRKLLRNNIPVKVFISPFNVNFWFLKSISVEFIS